MRTMVRIALGKFPRMRIPVRIKSANFAPNSAQYVSPHTSTWTICSKLHTLYAHIAEKRNSTENSSILLNKRSEKVAI